MYKNNHFIPEVYIDGFLDPMIPKHYEPYVWIYDATSKELKNKAPSNIFSEKNLYTEYDRNLKPIYEFEKYFNQKIETPFAAFKKKYIEPILRLDQSFINQNFKEEDRIFLSNFILWQIKRTKKFIDEMKKISFDIYKTQFPKIVDVNEFNSKFLQNESIINLNSIGNFDEGVTMLEYLLQRNIHFTVIDTDSACFISSDNPVLRTNPRNDGTAPLDDPDTEFTIPLTSKIALSLFSFGSNVSIFKIKDRKEVRRINQSFAKNSYRAIFGCNKALIESLINHIPQAQIQ